MKPSLRGFIRPFFQKFHPDVQKDATAKKVNLLAVQNVNSYLDIVHSMISSSTSPRKPSENSVQVNFIAFTEDAGKKKLREVHLRKNVSLRLPPWNLLSTGQEDTIHHHAISELAKLLKISGIDVPKIDGPKQGISEESSDAGPHSEDEDLRRQSRYEQSRARFMSRIDWKKYLRVYRKAYRDYQADVATNQLLRNNPTARRRHLNTIVSRIRVLDSEISIPEQAIAFRRLYILFDEYFDVLRLDDWARHWETVQMELVSGSKFVYSVDSADQVSFQIPTDWDEDEKMVKELQNGISDYHEWLSDDGLDDIFHDGDTASRRFVF